MVSAGGGHGVGNQVPPQGWGRTMTPGRKMLEWDTIPSPPSSPDSGRCHCPHAVTQGPGSQLVMENDRGLGTHGGPSEASRTRGTRLTTVSLEDKEAGWRVALGRGGQGRVEGKMGPEEPSRGHRAGESGGRGGLDRGPESRAECGSSVLTGAPRAPVGPAGPLGPASP